MPAVPQACCQTNFWYIGNVDSNSDSVGQVPIGDGNDYGIGVFCFVIKCGLGPQLTGIVINTKRSGICSTEGVCQCVIVRICSGYSRADVYTGCGVFCDSASGGSAIGEYRGGIRRRCRSSKGCCLRDTCHTDAHGVCASGIAECQCAFCSAVRIGCGVCCAKPTSACRNSKRLLAHPQTRHGSRPALPRQTAV